MRLTSLLYHREVILQCSFSGKEVRLQTADEMSYVKPTLSIGNFILHPCQYLVGANMEASLQRIIPTRNNHQAIATKIMTVISFGVGEGIKSSSNYSHVGNKEPTLGKLIQPIGIVLLFSLDLRASESILGKKHAWPGLIKCPD